MPEFTRNFVVVMTKPCRRDDEVLSLLMTHLRRRDDQIASIWRRLLGVVSLGIIATVRVLQNLDTIFVLFSARDKFSYKNLTTDEMVKHISRCVANVWQMHPC